MKYTLKTIAAVLIVAPLYAHAGGDPEHVKFPEGYEKTFTKYATMNRANQTQVAKLYANEAAISGYTQDQKGAFGSVIVMEIYTPKKDADGKPYSPGWHTVNLKATYQLSKNLLVTTGWENITNQRYRPYSSGIVAAGSNFIISLRVSL